MVLPAAVGTASAEPPPKTKVYDHSRDKGKAPGTHGPLPKGFSTTEISVKFRTDRELRVRGHRTVARNAADAPALTAVLAKYPGAWISPVSRRPEKDITAERATLEKRTGRELPDMNSWFTVTVPKGIEPLLDDLNALPSVEIAQAKPISRPPNEPLRAYQSYRNPAGSSAGAGVDADYANSLPGGKGNGITVTDIEGGERVGGGAPFTQGSVAGGEKHSLMVEADTGRGVWAWGDNSQGQLGNGTTTTSPKAPVQVSGLTGVKAVAAAGTYSIALKTNGTVWAWGGNAYGQLGNGTTTGSTVPVQVTGISNAVSISAGMGGHVLAVLSDGTVKAWGSNSYGQLGDNTTTGSPTPITIPGLTGVSTAAGAVGAGFGHSVAVLSNGEVKTWGLNASGQLGNGTTTNSKTPVALTTPTGVQKVSAGGFHTLAVVPGGTVRSWGHNNHGQLGDGSTTDRHTPVPVSGLTSVTAVAAGAFYSTAIRSDYRPWAWGENGDGQLGTGDTTGSRTPVQVATTGAAGTMAAGTRHTVAVFLVAAVYTWGDNSGGQLGTISAADSSTPVQPNNLLNAWNSCHEELANRSAGPPIQVPPLVGDRCRPGSHGTPVIGIIGAQDDNGVGMAGVAPQARLQITHSSVAGGAIAYAAANSQAGDVILMEFGHPGESDPLVYDQIVSATAKGVTVVEPAGNFSMNLDDPNNPTAVAIMSRPNSGAIMVGGGEPPSLGGINCEGSDRPAARTAMSYSTYGSRVDVQGYGACVASIGTPGFQNLTPSQTNPNKMYRNDFNGTSGASPIVAGAVADLQGIAKLSGGVLTPAQVRQILKQTGTPQPAGDPRHIGPLPNLRAAIDALP